MLESARGLPRPPASVLVHGDLHMRHVLVDDAGAITGVIDWGDVCAGDPAVDMSLYWSLLTPDGRREFLAEYGALSEEQLLHARVLSLSLCAILAVYADRERMDAVRREALEGLRRTVVD
jgi:aminoglycoside phosphotransferase (APT) family kinase protein